MSTVYAIDAHYCPTCRRVYPPGNPHYCATSSTGSWQIMPYVPRHRKPAG